MGYEIDSQTAYPIFLYRIDNVEIRDRIIPGEEGKKLADLAMANAKKYGVRFVGPNGLTVANTSNGLCLPFVPLYKPLKGGFSIITQSGALGLAMIGKTTVENIGLSAIVSVGNKCDVDEL